MNRYNLAGINFLFHKFCSDDLWSNWQWKLDSYRTSSQEDIVIQQDSDIMIRNSGMLLMQECSGFFSKSIHLMDNGDTIWTMKRRKNDEVCLEFHVNFDRNKITLTKDNTKSAGSAAFEYLSNIVPEILLHHKGLLTLHSALVEYEGEGFAVCAPSGTGKTTHARMWRDFYQALIINGDRSTLQIKNQKVTAYGLPWSGTSGEQMNRTVPMKAIVILERAQHNEAHRISGLEAFGEVLAHVQYPVWDRELAAKAMDGIEQLLNAVPVIRLSCLPNQEAVEVLKKELECL